MENKRFNNREISWLAFNERVLQEAEDNRNLLGDKIKFLSIFSSNQDEFFRVRVAMLKRLCLIYKKEKKFVSENPIELMHQVKNIVKKQRERFERIYKDLIEELKTENIYILREKDLSKEQMSFVLDYFFNKVRPQIFPMMIDKRLPFPYLKDESLYLAVQLAHKNGKRTRFSIIEIPTISLPRFVKLPTSDNLVQIILIDEIVRCGLPSIYDVHNFRDYQAYNFKVTRDAELEIDEEDISISYVKKISEGIEKRKRGKIIRFVHDKKMPDEMLKLFISKNKIKHLDTLSPGGRYHNLKDFMIFPKIAGLPTTKPNTPFRHSMINQKKRIFSSIKKGDLLLFFPYHTFNTIIDLIRDASIDPGVTSIKVTLYRVAKFSSIGNALINARRNRKDVTVLLELQARFDEENNIFWAKRFQNEGIKVFFGISGLKVHSKLCMISRREGGKLTKYCSIGTGNLNEETARLYTDCALLTANQEICEEVNNLFYFLERNIKYNGIFKHLLVSPVNARSGLNSLIDYEIKKSRNGEPAWIKVKINNLADRGIAEKLYEASSAGVEIQIICRSHFTIKPEIGGLSENISAISIIDKYLEHSRFFIFHHDGENLTFIGSADWQTRNI